MNINTLGLIDVEKIYEITENDKMLFENDGDIKKASSFYLDVTPRILYYSDHDSLLYNYLPCIHYTYTYNRVLEALDNGLVVYFCDDDDDSCFYALEDFSYYDQDKYIVCDFHGAAPMYIYPSSGYSADDLYVTKNILTIVN